MAEALGRFGVWRLESLITPDFGELVEGLGFGALWIGSASGDLELAQRILAQTTTLTVATGIINIWKNDPETVAASFHRLEASHPGRLLLGIGVGHSEHAGARYSRPYEALQRYLEILDVNRVPKSQRILAALGPRVLKLSADRSAGAHPYLVTPLHTHRSRAILGAGPLLAPEQKVVIDADPMRARRIARTGVEDHYLRLTNYRKNWMSLGFSESDLANGGSDVLIDSLVSQGEPRAVGDALRRHLDAGADHVAIQLLSHASDPSVGLSALAEVLFRQC